MRLLLHSRLLPSAHEQLETLGVRTATSCESCRGKRRHPFKSIESCKKLLWTKVSILCTKSSLAVSMPTAAMSGSTERKPRLTRAEYARSLENSSLCEDENSRR